MIPGFKKFTIVFLNTTIKWLLKTFALYVATFLACFASFSAVIFKIFLTLWCQTFFFFLAPKSLQMVTAAMKLKDTYSLEEKL